MLYSLFLSPDTLSDHSVSRILPRDVGKVFYLRFKINTVDISYSLSNHSVLFVGHMQTA